ncbi:MAG TPA: SHOCT domain-containing protein, partial [Flavobacteriales bacterium]|nr:SHOCT domain-containing protein [Flavobacteriales bacterium]
PAVLMKEGFLPELESQIHGYGVKTSVYEGDIPSGCEYSLEYTANWAWDMAMYLTYLHIEVRKDGNVVGMVEYDARRGGANMGKFGHTAEKMRPLLAKMFAEIGS